VVKLVELWFSVVCSGVYFFGVSNDVVNFGWFGGFSCVIMSVFGWGIVVGLIV